MAANASAAMKHFDPQLALVLKEAELPIEGQMPVESMEHKLSSAFVPPTLTAFTSRLRMSMDNDEEIIAGRAGHSGDSSDEDKNSDTGDMEIGKAASDDASDTQTTAIDVIASVANANECAIEDSDYEEDEKKNDKNPGESTSAIANSDEDWEDEDGASYNADGTAVIKTAVAIRRDQLQFQNKYQRYLRQKKLPVELEGPQVYESKGHLSIIGLPVKPARNPDGSLVSNLSLQLRRHAEMAAASSNNSLVGSAASSSRSSRGALPAPRGSPFTTGNPQHPDPLRCHPGPVTPPLTPPYHGAQSPQQPPPAPPSTPYSPPPSRFASNMSLQAALTPPMSPSTAMVSMATAVATILSSTASSSSISTASSTGSASGTAPSTSPDTASSTNTTDGVVMRVAQSIGSLRPFGNNTLQAAITATSNASNNNDNSDLVMRPTLIRSASCHLLGAEISGSLHNHIIEENNSRHRFNQYGPRRRLTGGSQAGPSTGRPPTIFEKDEDACATALSPPPIQRTRSAPSVAQTTYHIATLAESPKGKGKAVMHNGFRDQPPSSPEVDLAAKLAKNECYDFAHGYHAKGW